MIQNIVAANQLEPTANKTGPSVLGKDDFLKLMLVQMRYQDPLEPQGNEEMLAQLAQFTSLEQMNNLNDSILESNGSSLSMNSTSLLGKEVDILDPTSDSSNPQLLSTRVKSVSFSEEGPLLSLENGYVVKINDLVRVKENLGEGSGDTIMANNN